MSLLRWMGLPQPSASTSTNTTSTSNNGANLANGSLSASRTNANASHAVVNTADAKRFGLENFGNTCYVNSVLQALYFCPPFREQITATPDRSHLYPTPPPLVIPQIPISSHTATSSPSISKTSFKPGTTAKSGTPKAGAKRPASTGDSKDDKDDRGGKDAVANGGGASGSAGGSALNLGPPISMNPPNLFEALRGLFVHISRHTHDKGAIAPQVFIAKLKRDNELFRTTMHQDAHEFLNYLINRIVEDLEDEERLEKLQEQERKKEEGEAEKANGVPNGAPAAKDLSESISTPSPPSEPTSSPSSSRRNGTFVHDLFEGTLTSETRCLTCETVSSRSEPFLDLSIDILPNTSITACLRQFSASEMLCQRNKFFCDACCGLQEAEKRMKIKRLPGVLVVHLKRFKYQEEEQKYVKLNYRVAWPFELRLFNTVDDGEAKDLDRLYELWAVVVHIGGGPLHGHYITLIKSQNTWFVFDDNTVDTIKESDIPKYYGDSGYGTGYVLFYQAVDLQPPRQTHPQPTVTGDQVSCFPVPDASTISDGLEGTAISTRANPPDDPTSTPEIPSHAGPPSPAVPIAVESSSPSQNGNVDGTTPVSFSPLPSPTGPTAQLINADNPSPSNGSLPLPSPSLSPISVSSNSTATQTGHHHHSGGFFSSLRHSKSLKADAGKDKAAKGEGHKEKEREGWLSFRKVEKRRASVSQSQSQSQSQTHSQTSSHTGSQNQSSLHVHTSSSALPATPSSPKADKHVPPPSPRTGIGGNARRRSTSASIGGAMGQLASPARSPTVPSFSPLRPPSPPSQTSQAAPVSPNAQVVPTTSAAQTHTVPTPVSATRRTSATDQPPIDADSFSGSSSWTSGMNGSATVPTSDIPPLPTPIPIPSSTPTQDPMLSVGSKGQGTITQSPVPSTWSMPTTSVGDVKGEEKPIASVAGSSSAGLSDSSSGLQKPLHLPNLTMSTASQPSPASPTSAPPSSAAPSRTTNSSTNGIKDAVKARKAAEKAEEERKKAEKLERERLEKEHKEEKKLAKRASRKMSLGLGFSWGLHKDKDKDKDKERDKDRGIQSLTGSTRSVTAVNGD